MAVRNGYSVEARAAKMSARELLTQRAPTCEGCALLRTYPRPMCTGEKSEHFRTVRDTYHPRCQWYAIRGQDGKPAPVAPPAAPPPPEPKPRKMKLVRLREIDRIVTEDEYDALLSRNAKRRVGA